MEMEKVQKDAENSKSFYYSHFRTLMYLSGSSLLTSKTNQPTVGAVWSAFHKGL